MAFNWQKLSQARKDYARPKFALDAIGKHLKKRPGDPFVLAWKASILLLQEGDANDILAILMPLCERQPPITDLDLLCFVYTLLLEATRRANPISLCLPTVGGQYLKAWQNASKALTNRTARLELWSELFTIAMREDCWEDVRFAIVQANKEGPRNRKTAYYALILANQLAAEKRIEANKQSGEVDPGTQIQLGLAMRQLKDAYDSRPKPVDEAIRVSDMRDMRFMASIYVRQNRANELVKLWDGDRPDVVSKIMNDYSWDIMSLRTEVLQGTQRWEQLETGSQDIIEAAVRPLESSSNPQELENLCTKAWPVWSGLLDATTHQYAQAESTKRIEDLLSRLWRFPACLASRPILLTYMALTSYVGQSLLPLCKEYWCRNSDLQSCFTDLRRMVVQLSVQDQRDFLAFISEHTKSLAPASEDKDATSKWLRVETKVLLFDFLLVVSASVQPDRVMLEQFVRSAMRLHAIAAEAGTKCDSVHIAIIALLHLHRLSTESGGFHKYLVQAAILARRVVEADKNREDRNAALLSTRLHCMLGLGTIAFEHYHYAKVKEMLQDNVSWILLSRISQTHPFDVQGHKGFSADHELEKVISTIKRMEARTDDVLYTGLQTFCYDSALELLDLKRKLQTSLTKHLCIAERRRIARFRGTPVDRTLDVEMKDWQNISDNRNLDVIPTISWDQNSSTPTELGLYKPLPKNWLDHFRYHEMTCRLAYGEPLYSGYYGAASSALGSRPDSSADALKATLTLPELEITRLWAPAGIISSLLLDKSNLDGQDNLISDNLFGLLPELDLHLENFRSYKPVTGSSQNLWLESDYQKVYGLLEVLGVLSRLPSILRGITKQKSHPLHSIFSKGDVDALQEKVKELYLLIRKKTGTEMEQVRKYGAATITASMRDGSTGEAARALISDQEIKGYARDYVESALEAMGGILKVKLV